MNKIATSFKSSDIKNSSTNTVQILFQVSSSDLAFSFGHSFFLLDFSRFFVIGISVKLLLRFGLIDPILIPKSISSNSIGFLNSSGIFDYFLHF